MSRIKGLLSILRLLLFSTLFLHIVGVGGGTSTSLSEIIEDIWDSDVNRFKASDLAINTVGSK